MSALVGRTDTSVVIDAPLDLVWDMTNDVESWPGLFAEYASVRILGRDGDTVRFRLTTHPDEHGQVWSWISEHTSDREALRVTSRRVEPGPLEYVGVEWIYSEEPGGRTRMRWIQDFRMRPDAAPDVAAMTGLVNADALTQMGIIREEIEKAAR
ncbi:SRPBCC family protein [Streptosporangium sp. NPDC051022]|uniref:SRPBCC family protein n=1 Tax=Streptosporangium sp. NPDC051022 TaxID=3155752 RepID=UPI00341635EB